MACDVADLVQPRHYSVTAFPAQNGFCTRPVAHQRHDLACARPPLQGSFGLMHVARCVSAEYPSAKQVLSGPRSTPTGRSAGGLPLRTASDVPTDRRKMEWQPVRDDGLGAGANPQGTRLEHIPERRGSQEGEGGRSESCRGGAGPMGGLKVAEATRAAVEKRSIANPNGQRVVRDDRKAAVWRHCLGAVLRRENGRVDCECPRIDCNANAIRRHRTAREDGWTLLLPLIRYRHCLPHLLLNNPPFP